MATELQPARGTHDLIGEDQRRHQHVIDTARRVAASYGFDEWTTPIFEDTRVFSRTLGETSDVVMKEMYSLRRTAAASQVTLRPEATAGICRALVTNGLTQSLPQKVFCAGPMFRYERPQKGRYRQFHQIDIELIGSAEPLADAEVIACGWDILKALGVAGETVLEINTLGDKESRQAYRDALVAYFTEHQAALSADSLARLDRNPLRILDSKDEADRRIVANAPTIAAYLTEAAATFYARLQTLSRPLRRAVPREPTDRARPRLLRPHRVRIRHQQAGRAGHGDGRRPLRRPGGGNGRPAHARRRLGRRYRAPRHAAGGPAARARADRGGTGRRQRGSGGARTCCRRCATPASAPRWPIAATYGAAWNAPTASARVPR